MPDRIREQFELFHAANPHVFEELHRRASALLDVGVKRFGIALLYESMRYDHAIKTRGDDFKLNNNFRALYARLLIEYIPALEGVIVTRERAADSDFWTEGNPYAAFEAQ